jgi:hypothetical protein
MVVVSFIQNHYITDIIMLDILSAFSKTMGYILKMGHISCMASDLGIKIVVGEQ